MTRDERSTMSADDDPQSELNVLRREVRQLQADVRTSALQVAAGQDDIIQLRNALAAAEADIEEGLAREANLRMQLTAQTLKKEHVETTLAAAEALVSSLREIMEAEVAISTDSPIVHNIPPENNGFYGDDKNPYSSRETAEGYELEQVLNSIAEPSVQNSKSVNNSGTASSVVAITSEDETAVVPSTTIKASGSPLSRVPTPKEYNSDMATQSLPAVTKAQSASFTSRAKVAAEANIPTSPTVSSTKPTSPAALPRKASQRISSSNLLLSAFGQGATTVVHQGSTIHASNLQVEQKLPSEIEKIAKSSPAPRENALSLTVLSSVDDAHSGEIYSLASAMDSKWFASGGDDRTIRVYDMKGKPYATIGELPRSVTALSFHPWGVDSSSESVPIYAGIGDGSLRVFRRNPRRKSKWTIGSVFPVHTQAIRSLAFTGVTGSGNSLLLTSSTDRMIKLTDVEQGKRPFTVSTTSAVLDVSCFEMNGNLLVSGHKDGGLRLWSPQDSPTNVGGAKVHNKGIISVKCLDDGHSVVSLGRDDVIRLSDIRKNVAIVREMEGGLQCVSDWHRLAVEGRHVVCGKGRTGNLGVWNVDTGKLVRSFPSQLPGGDNDVIDMVTRKLRSPSGIVLPLWTASGSFVSAQRTRQVSFWTSQ